MTILIILGALLRVRKNLIRLGGLLELLFGGLIARILVGMVLDRHLPEGFFYLSFRSVAVDAKHLVIITFIAVCHNRFLYILKYV